MVKRGSHIVCMFLIYLLIMPVLHSANVFAGLNAGAHGYDEVLGFRKSTGDVTIINASAEIPGESVEPWQIKLLSDPTRSFSCEEDNETLVSSCRMTIPGELPAGERVYDVQLFNSDSSEFEPKKVVTLYVDESAPIIHSFELIRNGSDVLAVYQVSDSLCPDCPAGVCSGIGKIQFTLNYAFIAENVTDSEECLLINQTVLELEEVPGTTTKTICIDAYDRLLQKSSKCMDIVMDFTPPELLNASLWKDGKELRYSKGEPVGDVSLVMFFEEFSGMDMDSIVVDFSSLNSRGEYRALYRNVNLSDPLGTGMFNSECVNISETVTRCEVNKILTIIPEGTVTEVSVFASDNLTNHLNVTYALPLVFDNIRPSITAMRSGVADEKGRYWVGKGNNTIFLDIVEEGSGFENRQLFMDFSSFGAQPHYRGGTTLIPTNCTPGWICNYDLINVVNQHESGDVLAVFVTGMSMDDAGNLIEGVTNGGLYYDDTAPQIIGIQNSSVCPTAPDSIDIQVNVSERYSGGVMAEVSAPDLSSSIFPQQFECEESDTEGIWTCDIVIDNLVTFYVDGKINITLSDRAGNSNTTVINQEVCEAAPGTPPNVISTTSCSFLPSAGVDRQVAEMIPFPLFLRPTFTPISSGASIQAMKLNSCTSENGAFSDLYILDELNFVDPLLATKVTLSAEALGTASEEGEEEEYYQFVEPESETIDIECEMELTVRAGTKVYQDPEIETFRCDDVPLHGTVFGGIDSSLTATLADIEAAIDSKEKEIEDYEGWVDVLGAICTIAEIIAKLTMAIEVFKEVFWLALLIPYAIPQARSGIDNLFSTTCRFIEKLSGYISTIAWNFDGQIIGPSPDALQSTGFYIKLLCGILTCKLTEQNTWIELIGGNFDAQWSPTSEKSYNKFIESTDRTGQSNTFPTGDEEAPTSIPGDVYKVIFNAYRCKEMSIHGLCLPGYLYALRKERQLLCMKRSCYLDYVASGFSPEVCDKMYQGRSCLYVHSAAYKISGDGLAGRIAQGVVEYIIVQSVNTGIAIGLRALDCAYPWGINNFNKISYGAGESCGREGEQETFLGEIKHHICGIALGLALWMDVGDWMSGDDLELNYYNHQLESPDYCGE